MTPRALTHLVPILGWLRTYDRRWLRLDVSAGLTTAAVVVPKAMAYATVAGLPIQVGLYTALLPAFVYVLLGTSRAAVSSCSRATSSWGSSASRRTA